MTRREVLRLLGLGGAGLVAAACSRGLEAPATLTPQVTQLPTAPTPPQPTSVEPTGEPATMVPPAGQVTITPNEDFYVTSIRSVPPQVDPATWRLEVTGLVEWPLSLSLEEIKALPRVTEMRTLECISNPVGGSLIGNAVWEGTPLAGVLPVRRTDGEMASVRPEAIELKVEAAEGFSSSVPVELATHPRSLLVYHMNGEPLPVDHGFPLRVFYPGRYGMKQPKWVTRMELIDQEYLGYWEGQGWSNDAFIKVNSHIRVPEDGQVLPAGTVVIYGVAFSNELGVKQVEVSTDDGATWHPAELTRGPAEVQPYVWTEWRYRWTPRPGRDYVLAVRATDNAGVTQEHRGFSLLGGTYPDGTNAVHVVGVKVT